MKKALLAASCVALVFAITSGQADDKGKKEMKVKCVVAGKEIPLSKAVAVSYRNAKAYVCCNNCKAKFEKDSSPFATKANHQLFLTGQYEQVKCPIAGRAANSSKTVKISGATVAFCCGGCQGKAKKATGDDQLAIAFADKAFEKGFAAKKKSKK